MALVNGGTPGQHTRGRVDKVWRTVRWAESFPEEASDMDTVDLTPPFAIRKIANLFERSKFPECASLVRRLQGITLSSILGEVPIETLHEALPASLPIIEALYIKVHKSSAPKFPTGQLMTDQLVKRLVTVFAHQPAQENYDKDSIVKSCRTIISIIMCFETKLKDIVLQRKRAIDRCLRNMGKHGMVDSSGGKLMLLHDALKVELEKIIIQYKCALQKLDELCLSAKHPATSSVSSGPAPSEASHQRLMLVNRADVQDRVIKNKTLHNAVEPAISNQYLRKLIVSLQRRIEYDKILLFHDTELRKMSEGMSDPHVQLSQTLRQFSHGYGKLLAIIADILGEVVPSDAYDENLFSSEDENESVSMSGTMSILERMKIISLSGIVPFNGHAQRSGRCSLINSVEENNNTALAFPTQSDKRTNAASSVIISNPRRGYRERPSPHIRGGLHHHNHRHPFFPLPPPHTNGTSPHISYPIIPMGMDVASQTLQTSPLQSSNTAILEQELRYLRDELAQSKEHIHRLQDQEQQLRDRLSTFVHRQFTTQSTSKFEDLNLGSLRPTSLIRSYDDLYREGRVDTLDALDALPALKGLDILKMKILFSVVVLSFRCVQQTLHELKGRLRHMLCLSIPEENNSSSYTPGDVSRELEQHINNYLCKTIDTHDINPMIHEVCENIYATLYDYPGLKSCNRLLDYAKTTVRLAWGLTVQNPPFYIAYDSHTFQDKTLTRFHTSDSESADIKSFLWPILVDGQTGQCVARGVVIT